MAHQTIEWAEVAGNTLIVAHESGEVWIRLRDGAADDLQPFRRPMTCKGAIGSTTGLLDGAINVGFSEKIGQPISVPPSIPRYMLALVAAYHTSVNTPRNLRNAAARFKALGRPEVTSYLEKRAREETGHDRLALKDLTALGIPAEKIVANYIPAGIKPLCDRFDRLCAQDYPIGSVGYSYCLERTAALKQASDIEDVRAICPPDVDATRFLRSHSCLGSEVAHVEETIEFVAALPAADRIKVVQATYETALLMAEGYRHELLKSDSDICEELRQAGGAAVNFDSAGRENSMAAGLAR